MDNPTQETVSGELPTAPPRATPRAVARGTPRRWASPRFWTCVILLAVTAVCVQVLPSRIGMFLRKEAVPLRTPLQHFDATRLGPRYVRNADTDNLAPLGPDMLDSLGTREYLQILVTDTQKPANDPTRVAQVFVTYYTGQPDAVPHVPEECYLAGGWEAVGNTTAQVRVPGVGAPDDEVPVHVTQFRTTSRQPMDLSEPRVLTVMYFFHANDSYVTTRNGVRTKLMSPFERYAYYAKVEVNFPGAGALGVDKGRAASLEALAPLLEQLMPILINEHFDLRPFREPQPTRAAGT